LKTFLVVGAGIGRHYRLMQYLLAAVIGLFGGLTSGLFGVGGGIVMVPAMVWMLHTNIKTAIGTSLAVIIPTAVTGVLKHQQLGNIDWRMAGSLVPLAIVGGFFGAALTKHIPADVLKRCFGGFMMLAGLRLLFFKG
jgi:uncharacterized membrane protein YfcA